MARPQTPHVPSCRLKPTHSLPPISFRVRAENTREILRVHERGKSRSGSGARVGDGDGDGDGSSNGKRKNQLTNLPGIRHASYSISKPWVDTVVGNKTVFRHEISVQLCRLRRIKSSYESHVIDVVDFRAARGIRHYVYFDTFVAGDSLPFHDVILYYGIRESIFA